LQLIELSRHVVQVDTPLVHALDLDVKVALPTFKFLVIAAERPIESQKYPEPFDQFSIFFGTLQGASTLYTHFGCWVKIYF